MTRHPPDPLPETAGDLPLLSAFLAVHAQGAPVPAALYARGEALHRRLAERPPAGAEWGRFLVALGELAAEAMGDDAAASRHFLAALRSVAAHGDNAVAVAAGYNQGVLQERRGNPGQALAAYRAAAEQGFRLGAITAATLHAAIAAVRLGFAAHGRLDDGTARLLKQAWLGWCLLADRGSEPVPPALASELGRTLAAFLLPEDDPAALVPRWRRWPPHAIAVADADGEWRDDDARCLRQLHACAVAAAGEHLADEGGDPAAAYRRLAGEAAADE